MGNLVINKMKAWQGSMGIAPCDGIVSPAYFVFEFKIANPSFGQALLRSKSYVASFARASDGVRVGQWDLNVSAMRQIPVLLPPADEQDAIVRFLDWATGRLDRAIRIKRKLIALLNEQKQTIIHRAVTRGIDPGVQLKQSGLRHLPAIPCHWETVSLGRAIKGIDQGWSPVGAEGELRPDQWAVLTLSSINRGLFDPTAIKPIALEANVPQQFEISDGDLLLTRSNTRERVGDVCIASGVRSKTILCDLIYRLRVRDRYFHPEYLAYQLLSPFGRYLIERDARGSSGTMPKISQAHIRRWRLMQPPLREQVAIARFIDEAKLGITKAIQRVEKEIKLVAEFRTRLITDVVTGKFDVRDVQIPGDEMAESVEPLEPTELDFEEESIEEYADAD
jgi:type I restriction enzyme S subunit